MATENSMDRICKPRRSFRKNGKKWTTIRNMKKETEISRAHNLKQDLSFDIDAVFLASFKGMIQYVYINWDLFSFCILNV